MLTLICIYGPHLDLGIGMGHCLPVLLGVIILTYVRPERGLIEPVCRLCKVIYLVLMLTD